MTKNGFGVFEIVVPPVNGQVAIPHNSKIKVSFISTFPDRRPWMS
jgi:1,4-alpha-glucan branching enzyme